jgi:hypothetical protein
MVACLAYSSTLKMEEVCSPETPVNFYQTTHHHTAEDSILHSHRRETTKSNKVTIWLLLPVYFIAFSKQTYVCLQHFVTGHKDKFISISSISSSFWRPYRLWQNRVNWLKQQRSELYLEMCPLRLPIRTSTVLTMFVVFLRTSRRNPG